MQALGFSEHEAYLRIEVARAGRRFPVLFEMIEKGSLHLTGASLVAPHLTPENRDDSSHTYLFSFAGSARCRELLDLAKDLASHRAPGTGDIVEAALELYVEKLENERFKRTDRPREASPRLSKNPRHIPAHVKRAVYERDGGRCTYVGTGGHRCGSRAFLQYDHVDLVSRGGEATIDTIRLRCFRHNQLTAKQELGPEHMAQMSSRARKRPPSLGPDLASLWLYAPPGMKEIELPSGRRLVRPPRWKHDDDADDRSAREARPRSESKIPSS